MKKTILVLMMLILAGARFATAKESTGFKYEVLKRQPDVVWGFDFLSGSEMIFTERKGALRVLDLKTKKVRNIGGAPKVFAGGQGGLLDVRVGPEGKIFLAYAKPVGGRATTALGVGRLKGDQLVDFKEIFAAAPVGESKIQFGSRIEFDDDGHLFISVGDRDERDSAQDLSTHLGKILRLTLEGRAAEGNPFIKDKKARPEIWSYGHRNQEGLVRDRASGSLWSAEMGPRGGDELNLIEAGRNYGWPVITYGREYSGPKIGEGVKKAGMEQPVAYWVPSISPSGITIYTGSAFPAWKGDIFMANLSGQHLRRLVLKDKKVVRQEEMLKEENMRVRNVRTGPDGFLYLSTDDGKIARLRP
jgi:glucose/arabinose dehydrogenase